MITRIPTLTRDLTPPTGYSVLQFFAGPSDRSWTAIAPTGKALGAYSTKRYAVNRCTRHLAGLTW